MQKRAIAVLLGVLGCEPGTGTQSADTASANATGSTADSTGLTEPTAPTTDSGEPVPLEGCYAVWDFDYQDDGTIEGIGHDQYDDVHHDRVVYQQREFSPLLNTSDWSATYTYDEPGNLLTLEVDYDLDGVDYRVEQTWDSAGNVLTYVEDQDGDGTPDWVLSFHYDEAGVRQTAEDDEDGDGIVDRWWTYSYDAQGREVLLSGDQENDGIAEATVTTKYSDPKLEVGESVLDDPIGGPIEQVSRFERDVDGNLLFQEDDFGADDSIEYTYRATYAPDTGVLLDSYVLGYGAPPNDQYLFEVRDDYAYDDEVRLVDHALNMSILEPYAFPLEPQRERWTFGGTCP